MQGGKLDHERIYSNMNNMRLGLWHVGLWNIKKVAHTHCSHVACFIGHGQHFLLFNMKRAYICGDMATLRHYQKIVSPM